MSRDQLPVEEFFGPAPGDPPPRARQRRFGINVFAGISRTAFDAAPPHEQFIWRLIATALFLACAVSAFSATVTAAFQTGRSPLEVAAVAGPVAFALVLVLELTISISLNQLRRLTALIVCLLLLRVVLAGAVGYVASEAVVIWMNSASIEKQLATDLDTEARQQSRAITGKWKVRIVESQKQLDKLLKRQRAKEAAIRYYSDSSRCRSAYCAATAARLERWLDDWNARNQPNIDSLNTRIATMRAERDKALEDATTTIAASGDLAAREEALDKLMADDWSWTVRVWVWRAILFVFELAAVVGKLAFVRSRRPAADAYMDAEHERAALGFDYVTVVARAQRRFLEKADERWPQVAGELLDLRVERMLTAEREAPLRLVPQPQPAEPVVGVERVSHVAAEDEALAAERARSEAAESARDAVVDLARLLRSPDGRYTFERPIGFGTYGQVWRGYDHRLRRAIALKIPSGRFGDDERLWLEREMEAAVTLRYDGIVAYFDSFELADGRLALVLELVEGPSLEDEWRRRRAENESFSLTEVARIGRQICDSLAYLHGHGKLHLDVKMANVLGLGSDRGPKLGDFGLAARIGNVPAGRRGTPNYAPPEQRAGGPLDERTDLYPVAVILYELVTGERLFGEQGRFTPERPPTVAEVGALTGSLTFARLIAGLLAPDPDQRQPGSATEFAASLQALLGEEDDGRQRDEGAVAPDPDATAPYADDEPQSDVEPS